MIRSFATKATSMPRSLPTGLFITIGFFVAASSLPATSLVYGSEPRLLSGQPSQFATQGAARALTLAQCRALALAHHPRIKAKQQSLIAAVEANRALEAMTPGLLSHQLAVRQQQSQRGLHAASVAVEQAVQITLHDVDRTYFTVLFARDQERLAKAAVDSLAATYDTAKRMLDAGAKDVTSADVNRNLVYLRLAHTRREEATHGAERALAALRQALGQGPEFNIDVPAGKLPVPIARPERSRVIAAALARRAEQVQARVFADVAALEIKAQGASRMYRVQTFAAGSDIHAQTARQGVRDRDYRPGAIAPEMPTLLVGSRENRMQRAAALHGRAEQLVEHTSNLIALEADDAFLRWQEATKQLGPARVAAETAEKLAEDTTKDFTARLKVRVENVISDRVLASQARSQYNQILYNQILALADLERVTGGGFCANLCELIPPRP